MSTPHISARKRLRARDDSSDRENIFWWLLSILGIAAIFAVAWKLAEAPLKEFLFSFVDSLRQLVYIFTG